MEVYSRNGLVEIITYKDRSPRGEKLYILCRNLANKIDKVIVTAAKDSNIPLNAILPLQFSFEFLHTKMRFNVNFKFQGNAVYKEFLKYKNAIGFIEENPQDPKVTETRLIDYISNALQYVSRKDSSVEDNIRYKEFATKGLVPGNFQVNFRNLKKDLGLIGNLTWMVCESLGEIDTDEVIEKEIEQGAPSVPASGYKYEPYKYSSSPNTKFDYFVNLKAPLNDRNDINRGWTRLLKENLEKTSVMINKLMNLTAEKKVLFGLACTSDLVGKATLYLYVPTLDTLVRELPSDRVINTVKIDENTDYLQALATLVKMEPNELVKSVRNFSSFNILMTIILKPYEFFNINSSLKKDKKYYESPYAILKDQFENFFKYHTKCYELELKVDEGTIFRNISFKNSIRNVNVSLGKYRLHTMLEINNNLQFSIGFDFTSDKCKLGDMLDKARIVSILECIRGFTAITNRIGNLKEDEKFLPKLRVYFNNTKDLSKSDNIITYVGSNNVNNFVIKTINILDNTVKEPKINLDQINLAFETFVAINLMSEEFYISLNNSDPAKVLGSFMLEKKDEIEEKLAKVYINAARMDDRLAKEFVLDSLSNRLHNVCLSKIDFYRNKAVLK